MCRVLFLAPRQTQTHGGTECSFISKSHRRWQNASSKDAMNCTAVVRKEAVLEDKLICGRETNWKVFIDPESREFIRVTARPSTYNRREWWKFIKIDLLFSHLLNWAILRDNATLLDCHYSFLMIWHQKSKMTSLKSWNLCLSHHH